MESSEIEKQLGKDIKEFLESYGKIKADYDPEYDEEYERFSSPDASELLYCSERLEQGGEIERFPWSDYSSGGYKRGAEVLEQHQALLERIKPFVKK